MDVSGHDRKIQLRRRLGQLEAELANVYAQLSQLGPGETLPGLYLLIETYGFRAALPASQVLEIVRLVETTPLPCAPAHVLGTFLYRGEPVVALDLDRFVGAPAGEPELDAHMIVLAASRTVALVVERVKALIEAPTLAEAPKDAPAWLSSPLVSALCHAEQELVPVLRIDPLLEGVRL